MPLTAPCLVRVDETRSRNVDMASRLLWPQPSSPRAHQSVIPLDPTSARQSRSNPLEIIKIKGTIARGLTCPAPLRWDENRMSSPKGTKHRARQRQPGEDCSPYQLARKPSIHRQLGIQDGSSQLWVNKDWSPSDARQQRRPIALQMKGMEDSPRRRIPTTAD